MVEKTSLLDLPVPEEYLLELGKITIIYGHLEMSVDRAISKLAGFSVSLDWRISIMLAHANFQQRMDALGALLNEAVEEYPNLKKYKSVIERIKKTQKQRNRYIHSHYTLSAEGKVQIWSTSARGKMKINHQVVYIQDLRNLSLAIHSCITDLLEMVNSSSSYEKRA